MKIRLGPVTLSEVEGSKAQALDSCSNAISYCCLVTISKSRPGSPEGLTPLAGGLGGCAPRSQDPEGGRVGTWHLPF